MTIKAKEKLSIRDSITVMEFNGWSRNQLIHYAKLSGLEYDPKELERSINDHEKTKDSQKRMACS